MSAAVKAPPQFALALSPPAPLPSGTRENERRTFPPPWDEQPVALVEGTRLSAVSGAAARAGVRMGMTVSAARGRCAGLDVIEWDAPAIAHALTETTARFLTASPQVTPAAGEPGLWWIGAGGLDEQPLARDLLALARAWHPRARVAIADACVTARAATWSTRGTAAHIVPAGGDAAYLAPAPLALIPVEREMRAALGALGIRTAGALAGLSAEDVERRWGAAGLAAWRFARGEDARRPVLAVPAARHAVSAELASPAETMEPILFLVRAALERLAPALAREGRAAAALAITLTLDDARGAMPFGIGGAAAHTVTREVRFPRAVARAAPLFDHCRALLARWPLDAAVCGVTVAVAATAPASAAQGDLLAQRWHDPAAADAALARLRAELGPDTVVRPVERDAHAPERAGGWTEEQSLVPRVSAVREPPIDAAYADDAPALRLLEVPEEIDVEFGGGRPCGVWWRGERLALTSAAGPERLSGDWWSDPYRRDYWRGVSARGELLVYAEGGKWFVQGWYD
jgi:protein ImuB